MKSAKFTDLMSRLPVGWTFTFAPGAGIATTRIDRIHFAVPDLHGAAEKARAVIFALEMLGVKRAVFLGDMIDRGSNSRGTVDAIIAARKRNPSWVILRGNHEQIFIEGHDSGAVADLPDSLFGQLRAEERGHYAELFRALPTYHETANLIFVHGGVSWSHWTTNIGEVPEYEQLWSYDISRQWAGKKLVRGHQHTDLPEEFRTHVSLETYGWRVDRPFTVGVLADIEAKRNLIGWLTLAPV
ncbi:MAG: hypothetical protein HC888_06340 [Candidatus Competibacteraceae bacterium]|nr:hypothetical protein [Candidatus Competibacteraceae bacterium]